MDTGFGESSSETSEQQSIETTVRAIHGDHPDFSVNPADAPHLQLRSSAVTIREHLFAWDSYLAQSEETEQTEEPERESDDRDSGSEMTHPSDVEQPTGARILDPYSATWIPIEIAERSRGIESLLRRGTVQLNPPAY